MKIDIICRKCGSRDVRRDAWAAWNVEKQDWELAEVFDAGFCATCDQEQSLDEVEIPQDTR